MNKERLKKILSALPYFFPAIVVSLSLGMSFAQNPNTSQDALPNPPPTSTPYPSPSTNYDELNTSIAQPNNWETTSAGVIVPTMQRVITNNPPAIVQPLNRTASSGVLTSFILTPTDAENHTPITAQFVNGTLSFTAEHGGTVTLSGMTMSYQSLPGFVGNEDVMVRLTDSTGMSNVYWVRFIVS